MIVTITLPAQTSRVNYGQASFMPDENHQLAIPEYVAKPLLALAGVTGAPIAQSIPDLLAGVGEEFECNYLFWALSQPLPEEDLVTAASALLAAKGEPAVSLL